MLPAPQFHPQFVPAEPTGSFPTTPSSGKNNGQVARGEKCIKSKVIWDLKQNSVFYRGIKPPTTRKAWLEWGRECKGNTWMR